MAERDPPGLAGPVDPVLQVLPDSGVDADRPPGTFVDERGVGLQQVGPGVQPYEGVLDGGDPAGSDECHLRTDPTAQQSDHLGGTLAQRWPGEPPGTGGRDLQAVQRLEPLLKAVRSRADEITAAHVPLLVKIAPDLTDEDVLEVADLAVALGLDGIVATNTTISREGLASPAAQVVAAGAGGLSGPPLRERATEVMRLLRGRVGPQMTLIGAGGITTVEDAVERLDAGADLLQAYTAFVYEGPWWPVRVNAGVREHLQQQDDQRDERGEGG